MMEDIIVLVYVINIFTFIRDLASFMNTGTAMETVTVIMEKIRDILFIQHLVNIIFDYEVVEIS
tara:strand:+ start:250 stop:441 length:192 start_codon:yes stop_codon:yes gene_type:complete